MNPDILKEIITTPMPYGKYKGVNDSWFAVSLSGVVLALKGFPKGKLGMAFSYYFRDKN